MARVTVRSGATAAEVVVDTDGHVRIEGVSYTVTPDDAGGCLVSDGQRQWLVEVAGPPDERWVWVDGQAAIVEVDRGADPPRRARSAAGDATMAPMPASVVKVLVAPGDRVAQGQSVIVLEAMKMELQIRAPRDGVVRAVHCAEGQPVQPGTSLVDIDEP